MEPGETLARQWRSSIPCPSFSAVSRPSRSRQARILDTLEQAYKMNGGRVEARGAAPGGPVRLYSRELSCPVCGEVVRRPTPALFSFNSPLGACPTCQGFGRVIGVDRDAGDPRSPAHAFGAPHRALEHAGLRGAVRPALSAACKKKKIPLNVPWGDLPEKDREWIWSGSGNFVSLDEFFELARRAHLQGPRARAAGPLPRLQRLPGLRRHPAPARGAGGDARGEDRAGPRRPEHRAASRLAPRPAVDAPAAGGGGVSVRRAARSGSRCSTAWGSTI